MHKYERLGLWALILAIAVATALNYGATQSLEEAVGSNTAKLERPSVEASVMPGIPAALRTAWTTAKNNAQEAAYNDQLWVTLRLTNRGFGRAGEVVADLSFVTPIEELFVYTADGDTFESTPYARPKLAAGGTGEPGVQIEFDELAPGESHLIFVGLRPGGFGGAPYDETDAARWLDAYALYWNDITVTSAEDAWAEEKSKFVGYGLGNLNAEVKSATPQGSKRPG